MGSPEMTGPACPMFSDISFDRKKRRRAGSPIAKRAMKQGPVRSYSNSGEGLSVSEVAAGCVSGTLNAFADPKTAE